MLILHTFSVEIAMATADLLANMDEIINKTISIRFHKK